MNVVIADDSPLVRERLIRLLTGCRKDVRTRETHDVRTTIASIEDDPPDALILDLRMPGGSGFDVLRYIQRRSLGTHVVVLTNFPSEVNMSRSLNLGAHFFFDKTKEFESALDVLLAQTPAQGLP